MSPGLAFVCGFAGGALIEFVPIFNLKKTPRGQWPAWVKAWEYYLLSLIGCLVGGGLAFGYAHVVEMPFYLALNVGAAWPTIINGFGKSVPNVHPPDADVG